jgi:8-amino-7-oxononanoate synthase
MKEHLAVALSELESSGLRRSLRTLASPQGPEVDIDGKRLHNFSSNDYLGLSTEQFLSLAAVEAIERYGTGSGASRLISGTLPPHAELEYELAHWKGCEAALAFSSGYATSMGVIGAVLGKSDVVILDKLCHACIVDGARLSGATLRIYPHNNLTRLESHLRWARTTHPKARILVATESVFSMDGDQAPLREIVALKEQYGAWLLLDEAHAVGVLSRNGTGLAEATGVSEHVEIHVGTLSKAMGCAGGYVCGSRSLIDWLLNRARSFVFSTAPPPAQAASGAAAIRWMKTSDAAERRAQLWENITRFYSAAGLPGMPQSAIVPVILGSNEAALAQCNQLQNRGFWVPAIRYPTVARGSARLRATITAAHHPAIVETLGHALRSMSLRESV